MGALHCPKLLSLLSFFPVNNVHIIYSIFHILYPLFYISVHIFIYINIWCKLSTISKVIIMLSIYVDCLYVFHLSGSRKYVSVIYCNWYNQFISPTKLLVLYQNMNSLSIAIHLFQVDKMSTSSALREM